MRTFLICLFAFTLLTARTEEQVKTRFPFDAAKIESPDTAKGTPLLRVFDEYLYGPDDQEPDANALSYVESFLMGHLFKHFRTQEKIEVTKDETERFLKAALKLDLAQNTEFSGEEKAALQKIAETTITAWKVEQLLYKRYGGVVIQSSTTPNYPLEAYFDLFRDLEKTKVLEVFDKGLRDALEPALLTEDHHIVRPENVDFKTPWWEKLDTERREAAERAQRRENFNPNKLLPPIRPRSTPVARVLSDYLYAGDLHGKSPASDPGANEKLSRFILIPLAGRLMKQEKIEPAGDEVAQCVRHFQKGLGTANMEPAKESNPDSSAPYLHLTRLLMNLPENTLDRLRFEEVPETVRKMSTDGLSLLQEKMESNVCQGLVSEWKLGRLLYSRYGGTVISQQSNPSEPVGAYRKFLEEMERTKVFEIFDKDDRKAFFEYYLRDDHSKKLPPDQVDFSKPWWEKTKAE